MSKITVYQKPTCTTCRQVYAALKDSGVDFDAVNYYTEPLSKTKIKELLKKMGVPAAALLRKKEDVFKKLNLDEKNLSEDELTARSSKKATKQAWPAQRKDSKKFYSSGFYLQKYSKMRQ